MADRAPVNGMPYGTIAWAEHEEAWRWYVGRYGTGQSAERIAERGGFGVGELATFLERMPTSWEPDSRTPKRRRGRYDGPASIRSESGEDRG